MCHNPFPKSPRDDRVKKRFKIEGRLLTRPNDTWAAEKRIYLQGYQRQPGIGARSRRNLWLMIALAGLYAASAVALSSIFWSSVLGALLGLAGVILFRGAGLRNWALFVASLMVSIGLIDMLAGWWAPAAHGAGIVATMDPQQWTVPDDELGYRPRPSTNIVATSTFGSETLFRVAYTINGDSMRATPAAPPGADTYLFMGDSFVFGQGLADDETLAAQFAKARDFKVRTVNFSAPGYAPNQLVRALETDRLDHLAGQHVKAVVTWIIPAHLARVAGDGPWLGSSPCYVTRDGELRFAGSFDRHRWRHPVSGLRNLVEDRFALLNVLDTERREEEQAEIFIALMLRLQILAQAKFGAPLVVVYSWPDEKSSPANGQSAASHRILVSTLAKLRSSDIPLVSVDAAEVGHDVSQLLIPHDGHPTALANRLVAGELGRRFPDFRLFPIGYRKNPETTSQTRSRD